MATGAVTVSKTGVIGNMKYGVVSIVGSSSYTTTGDALDLFTILGMSAIHYCGASSLKTAAPTVNEPRWVYDTGTKKLQAFGTAGNALGLTEATSTTDFSNTTVTLFVVGTG